jgi:hypothetical protein
MPGRRRGIFRVGAYGAKSQIDIACRFDKTLCGLSLPRLHHCRHKHSSIWIRFGYSACDAWGAPICGSRRWLSIRASATKWIDCGMLPIFSPLGAKRQV